MGILNEDESSSHALEELQGRKLQKLRYLAKKWGVASVEGEGFQIYDDFEKQCYKDLMIQVNLFGDEIVYEIMDEGCVIIEIKDIIELESKVAKKRYKHDHPEIVTNLCFNVKTKQRKVTFLCESSGERNAWVAGLRLLRANNEISKQFKSMRDYCLSQRLKPVETKKEESTESSSGTD